MDHSGGKKLPWMPQFLKKQPCKILSCWKEGNVSLHGRVGNNPYTILTNTHRQIIRYPSNTPHTTCKVLPLYTLKPGYLKLLASQQPWRQPDRGRRGIGRTFDVVLFPVRSADLISKPRTITASGVLLSGGQDQDCLNLKP